MSPHVLLFIVADALLTIGVLVFVLRRRRAARETEPVTPPATVTLGKVRALADFAKQQHERIGNHVQSQWSGVPDQLPGVLTSLLDQLEREAKAQSLPVDRDLLKTMLVTSLRSHRIGRGGDVREAFRKVA